MAGKIVTSFVLMAVAGLNASADDAVSEIEVTVEQLDAEIASYGGWQAWHNALAPFRADWRQRIDDAPNPEVVIGGDGHFFFKSEMNEQLPEHEVVSDGSEAESWSSVAMIADLDRQLRERDIVLLLGIVPPKLEIYPDALSDEVPVGLPVGLPRHAFMRALAARGVRVLDFARLLTDERPRYYRNLYEVRGPHWADHAMAEVSDALAKVLLQGAYLGALPAANGYLSTTRVVEIPSFDIQEHFPEEERGQFSELFEPITEIQEVGGGAIFAWRESGIPVARHGGQFHVGI